MIESVVICRANNKFQCITFYHDDKIRTYFREPTLSTIQRILRHALKYQETRLFGATYGEFVMSL